MIKIRQRWVLMDTNKQIAKLRVKCIIGAGVFSADTCTNMHVVYIQFFSRHGVRSGFWPLCPYTSLRLSVRSPLIVCSV